MKQETLEEQIDQRIDQEVSKQMKQIKSVCPTLQEKELKFIDICLRSAYTKGAMDALKLNI